MSGLIATTEPVKPFEVSWSYAVCCTLEFRVSWTLPPTGSRPVISAEMRRASSLSSEPFSRSFSVRSMPEVP